jgi:hypothetical protein
MLSIKHLLIALIIILATAIGIISAEPSPLNRLLTDIEVAYLYENEATIDWPLIYYLSVESGCRVKLVTVEKGAGVIRQGKSSENYNLAAVRLFIPDTTSVYFDSAMTALYYRGLSVRRLTGPDIVIFSGDLLQPENTAFENYLLGIKYDSLQIFNIARYYRQVETGDSSSVYLNHMQYLSSYYEQIDRMAASVMERPDISGIDQIYSIYALVKGNVSGVGQPSFLSNLERLKFGPYIKKYVGNLYDRSSMESDNASYLLYLGQALTQSGNGRIESLLTALNVIKRMKRTYFSDKTADVSSPLADYFDRTIPQLTALIFEESGIKCEGEVGIFGTSEGTKVKFISRINNNGPYEITASAVEFRPYWSKAPTTIDSNEATILPHNLLIREYPVAVEASQLETLQPESLLFAGQITLQNNPVDFNYSINTYEKFPLSLEFAPEFLVVRPFPALQIDRVVEPTRFRLIIKKPVTYANKIRLKIHTPSGVKLGAFNETVSLAAGERAIEVAVPLSLTRNIGSGKHLITASLLDSSRTLATDSAYIRLVDFSIKEKIKIALLPDKAGLLEDILGMSAANYRTISDRFLVAGDFQFYDLIILGTGCSDNYPSLSLAGGRIRQFMEYGGTVLVFGQPESWQYDLLPVSISGAAKRLSKKDFRVEESGHAIFNSSYKLNSSEVVEKISPAYISYPAIVLPATGIVESKNGTVLLSESKFGKGKLIYCGLPLPEMFRELNIDAIKLLSNLINYSGH